MKPLILHGHSRPIKSIKFNKDGDLVFTGSNDRYVSLWAAESGERIGTFQHTAAVNTMSITLDSKILITGDSTGGCYLWEIYTGQLLKKIDMDPTLGVRCVDLSYGDHNLCFSYGGRVRESRSAIDIYSMKDLLGASTDNQHIVKGLNPKLSLVADSSKFTSCKWINLNANIVSAREDGTIQLYDVNNGRTVLDKKIHADVIMDMDISRKEELIMTASKDGKANIIDPDTFDIIHTLYPQEPSRNLNACVISPLFSHNDPNEQKFHGIVAGGQEARDVTTSHAKKGGFDILIYSLLYGNELGSVQGHFGPVNALAFGPSGKIIASGADDATVRIHKLEGEYADLSN